MTRMRGRVVAAVAVALLAAGCGGEGAEESKPAVKAEAEVSVQEVTPSARSAADVPTPTAAQKQAYLAALRRIDPGLTVNEERVMQRAERVCARVLQGSGGGSLPLCTNPARLTDEIVIALFTEDCGQPLPVGKEVA